MSSESPSNQPAKRLSRRRILLALGKGATALGISAGGSLLGGGPLLNWLHTSFGPPSPLPGDVAGFAKEFLFGSGEGYKVLPSTFNPNDPERPKFTGPSADAVRSLQYMVEIEYDHIFSDDVWTDDYSGNLLMIGGPVANPHVRTLMGPKGLSPFSDDSGGIIRFPMYFDLERSAEAVEQGIYRSGLGLDVEKKIPVWHLNDGHKLIFPKLDKHRLTEDYILVTSIPNILDINSYHSDCRILIFTGAHSAGNRAMKYLICNQRLLARLLGLQKAKSGWQAVLLVPQLTDNSEDAAWISEDLIKVLPVRADFEKVARARALFPIKN